MINVKSMAKISSIVLLFISLILSCFTSLLPSFSNRNRCYSCVLKAQLIDQELDDVIGAASDDRTKKAATTSIAVFPSPSSSFVGPTDNKVVEIKTPPSTTAPIVMMKKVKKRRKENNNKPDNSHIRLSRYQNLIENAKSFDTIVEHFVHCGCEDGGCLPRQVDLYNLSDKIVECLENMMQMNVVTSRRFVTKYMDVVDEDNEDDLSDEERKPKIEYRLHNLDARVCKTAFMHAYGIHNM